MASSQHHDPHERPPDHIRNVYKKYQKMKLRDLDKDPDIVDFKRGLSEKQKRHIKVIKEYKPEELTPAFRAFEGIQDPTDSQGSLIDSLILVYEHSDMPGICYSFIYFISLISMTFLSNFIALYQPFASKILLFSNRLTMPPAKHTTTLPIHMTLPKSQLPTPN